MSMCFSRPAVRRRFFSTRSDGRISSRSTGSGTLGPFTFGHGVNGIRPCAQPVIPVRYAGTFRHRVDVVDGNTWVCPGHRSPAELDDTNPQEDAMNFKRLRGRIRATAVAACRRHPSRRRRSHTHQRWMPSDPEAHNNVMMQELPALGHCPTSIRLRLRRPAKPWIVGLGDSYMSGEVPSGRTRTTSATALWTFHWTGGINQVYGDNNGQSPSPMPTAAYSAPMHIGGDWNSKNLAVSGAEQPTVTAEGNRWKPGSTSTVRPQCCEISPGQGCQGGGPIHRRQRFGSPTSPASASRQYLIPLRRPSQGPASSETPELPRQLQQGRAGSDGRGQRVQAMEQAGKSQTVETALPDTTDVHQVALRIPSTAIGGATTARTTAGRASSTTTSTG